MTDKITMEGKYTTRDGREVILHTVNGPGYYPVIASISCGNDWTVAQYCADGSCNSIGPDLIPAKTKREGWVNVYPNINTAAEWSAYLSNAYATKEYAQRGKTISCIATVRIEWEE